MMMSANRGYTLIELLWALALSSLFGVVGIAAFARWTKALHVVAQQQEGYRATLKAHALLESALYSTDHSRLPFTILRTPGNALRLPNGAEHPVSALRGTSQPRADSDIISIVDISPTLIGEVQTASASGSGVFLEACGLMSAVRDNDYKSVIVMTLDGPYQAVGKVTNTSRGCVSFSGVIVAGIVSGSQEILAPPLRLLIVQREFSLLVDRSGELRFVSHTGSRILENQPVTRGYRSIHLEPLSDEAAGILFKVSVHASYSRPSFRFVLPSLLQRSIFSELLP